MSAQQITCFLDASNAIKEGNIQLLRNCFSEFLENEISGSWNCRHRAHEFLETAAAANQRECFDFVCELFPDKIDLANLMWAAAHQSVEEVEELSLDNTAASIERAAGVAIHTGRLDNLKVLLPKTKGTIGFLEPLWLSIYYHQKEIFDYLMTTDFVPKTSGDDGWNDMLEASVTYNFLCVFDEILPHADLSNDGSQSILTIAVRHKNQPAIDKLYPLYSKNHIENIIEKFEGWDEDHSAKILKDRLAQDNSIKIIEASRDTPDVKRRRFFE